MLCDVDFSLKNNKISLYLLLLMLVTNTSAAHSSCRYETAPTPSCRTSSETSPQTNLQTNLVEELARRNTSYQNSTSQNSFLFSLETESLQKVEILQNDPSFQETVKVLQSNSSQPQNTEVNSDPKTQGNLHETSLFDASLYIFVSFSMGEKALLNIAHEAKHFGATLVLRGFREGSYTKTAQSLQNMIIKTGQGVIIDPDLYTLFDITAVPTFVLAKPFQLYAQERTQTPIHDKLQGHVSPRYALERFAKEGDLKQEALNLLHRGVSP